MEAKEAVSNVRAGTNMYGVARFIEQQEQYAELGRLAVEITCKDLPPEISENYCDKNCSLKQICLKRVEMKGAE